MSDRVKFNKALSAKTFFIAKIVIISLLLSSCAVMTVDVDVYKGPLANHQDVQTQQVAALAIGAKPLILRLKNTMNSEDDKLKEILEDIENLYEDTKDLPDNDGSSEIAVLLKEGHDAMEQFLAESMRLVPDERANILEEIRWNHLDKKKYEDSQSPLDELQVDLKVTEAEVKKLVEDLRDGYKQFVVPEESENKIRYRKWKNIFKAHKEIWSKLNINQKIALIDGSMPNLHEKQINKIVANLEHVILPDRTSSDYKRNSSNFAFKTLQNKELLRFHAYLLFSDIGVQNTFVQSVEKFASSFTNVREGLHNFLTITLKGLAISHKLKFPSMATKRRAVSTASEISSKIINPLFLKVALDISRDNPTIQHLKDELEAVLHNGTLEEYVNEYEKFLIEKEKNENENIKTQELNTIEKNLKLIAENISRALFKVLEKHPEKISKALLRADKDFITETTLKKSKHIYVKVREKYKSQVRRAYGLSCVINEDSDKEELNEFRNTLADLGPQLEAALEKSSGISSRGRLPIGIFTLIEEYLEASHKDPLDCDEERKQLWDALVRFAQKVLFIVNHESLFKNKNNDAMKYVNVLQAVGNSIIVQIDALEQEKGFQKKLVDGRESELYAVNRSFSQLPEKVIDEFVASLQVESVENNEVLKKATASHTASVQSYNTAVTDVKSKRKGLGLDENNRSENILEVISKRENPVIYAYELILIESNERYQKYNDVELKKRIQDKIKKIKDDVKTKVDGDQNIANTANNIAIELVKELDSFYKSTLLNLRKNIVVHFKAGIEYLRNRSFNTDVNSTGDEAFKTLLADMKPYHEDAMEQIGKATVLEEAEEKLVTLANNKEATKTTMDNAKKKQDSLSYAVKIVNQVKPDILKIIEASPDDLTPRSVYALMRSTLSEKLAEKEKGLKENSGKRGELEPEIKKFKDAVVVMSTLPVPKDAIAIDRTKFPRDPRNYNEKFDAKDVMDQLIAILKYEYLKEVRQNGVAGSNASNISQALRTAYIDREDMVYLRPAMSYLRTSFTATSLQRNAPLAWKNMLREHGNRSFFPWSPSRAKDNEKMVAEIDKQYWQNINRVRVAGAGDTNYVIAKDDVGNWYVKSYSTDMKDIMKSTSNLAKVAMGTGMGSSFLSRTSSQDTDGQDLPSGTRPQTKLERKYSEFSDRYRGETIKVLQDLRSEIDSIKAGKLKTTWISSDVPPDKLQGYEDLVNKLALNSLENFLTDSRKKKEEKKLTSEIAVETLNGLQAFRKFHKLLDDELKVKASVPADKVEVEKAIKEVNKEIKGILDKHIKIRKTSIKQFEAAVALINEMTNP